MYKPAGRGGRALRGALGLSLGVIELAEEALEDPPRRKRRLFEPRRINATASK